MATTKAPAKKTAPAKTGTAIVKWDEQMASMAKRQAKQEVPYSEFKKISIRNGVLKIDDEKIDDNTLRCVVIGALHENKWFDSDFDPTKASVPACYAFNDPDNEDDRPEDTMKAHAKSENPQGQEDPDEAGAAGNPCGDCWANVMGTAKTGRGKACQNGRRLALITEDALESPEALRDAEVRSLFVPVMSTKFWTKIVNHCADELSRPYWGVVLELQLVDDPKSQFLVKWEFCELITFDQPLWDAMQLKVGDAMKSLQMPYPAAADLEQAAPKAMKPVGRAAQAMARVSAKPGGKMPAAKAPAGKTAAAGKGRKF